MIRDEPWTFGDETPVESRVLADPVVAADWTRRFGENLVERHHDGSAVFRFEVSDREGFRSFIAGHLDRVEVLSPRRCATSSWPGWARSWPKRNGDEPPPEGRAAAPPNSRDASIHRRSPRHVG
ncbi:MAG: WYL domain-containing protein [Acidimicrobiia bacterium]|nr:WYL domain-containing protein [Acidimicrobiia bacterium]